MFRYGSVGLALIQATPSSSGIPFRTESTVSMDRFVFAMLAITLLMIALIAALYVARRKGWLDGVGVRTRSAQGERSELTLCASRRVSPFTSIHVVTHGDQEFLVAESIRGATVQIHKVNRGHDGQEGAP